jgi:hypothetical protein
MITMLTMIKFGRTLLIEWQIVYKFGKAENFPTKVKLCIANRNCFCFIIINSWSGCFFIFWKYIEGFLNRAFIFIGKVNQIKRDICCLDIENGGMSMVNLDSYIDSRRIKFIYRIINEPIENWNEHSRRSSTFVF